MNKINPYREPAKVAAFAPSFKDLILHVFRRIAAAPGRWWRDLADTYKFLTILGLAATLLAVVVAVAEHGDPCARHVLGTVHGVSPEGLPADYEQSWCAEYKPGRGP